MTPAWLIDLKRPGLSSATDFVHDGVFHCSIAQMASDALPGAWGFVEWQSSWMPGAMLGGLLIGLIESFWASYVNAQYKDVAVYGVLMLVLLIRPNGLFGKPEIEKV